MKILALDTTSGSCSVALHCDGQVSEQFVLAERDHTQRLLPMVDRVLADAQLSLAQLDALAVSRGPGSFTGLRIAISCVQGLAFAADKPVLPVSSLAAMAAGAVRKYSHWGISPVIALLDARMQEVYCGVYGADSPNRALLPEAVVGPQQLVEIIAAAGLAGPLFGAGPGWHYFAEAAAPPELAQLPMAEVAQDCPIHARDIADLALQLWREGGCALAAEELEPLYLRNEVTWQKRQRIRSQ